jgi:cold shock CspA family protein
VRDEFNAIAYDGDDGSEEWSDEWREIPLSDGPTAGQIQVVADSNCVATNCLRLGPDGMIGRGVMRAVDLTAQTEATLTFAYRRRLLDTANDGRVWLRASTDGWNWVTLRAYDIDGSDSGPRIESVGLNDWVGSELMLVFHGGGTFDGYMFIDNIEVVMSTNEAPVFETPLPDRSDVEGDSVTVVPEVGDPDGDDLDFSASGLPPGISISPDTGVISGVLSYGAAGSSPYTTRVTASDGFEDVSDTFIWAVADLNRPPALAPIEDVSADEGLALQVTAAASDPDLPHDTLRFSLVESPRGASVNASGVVKWTPGESAGPGSYDFTVKVADSGSPPLTAIRSFKVVVAEVNTAPTVAPIPDQSSGAGDSVTLAVAASDGDLPANSLTYSATGLPPGVSISSTSGLISGTIAGSAPESNSTVTVKVSDNGSPRLHAIRTFSWQVTRGNHAPALAAIPDQNPEGGATVTFVASATDADRGDTLTFWLADGIDPVPAGASINAATGKFTWRPSGAQHGATYRINVGVSDSGSPRLSDTQLVTITVPRLNSPPQVTQPGRQDSVEGDEVNLPVRATDPDGDNVKYTATGLPPGLTIGNTTGVIGGTVDYVAAADSPFAVEITVTDDGSPHKSSTVSFDWFVTDTNRAPTVSPLSLVAIVGEPTSVVLDAVDPDGDELEFSVANAPILGTLEGEGPEFTYTTPGGGDSDGFTILVGDGEFEVEAEVVISVRAGNSVPTADADTYDVAAGELLRVDAPGVLGNDSDLDAEPLTAVLVSEPAHGRLVLQGDGSFTYLPDSGFSGGDKFVYAAVDGLGEQSTATVVVNVNGIDAPPLPPVDDRPHIDVVVATTTLWQPAVLEEEGAVIVEVPRAVVSALNAGITSLPELRFPLLLLLVALLLGLTIGRVSVLPLGAGRRQEEGWVHSYDEIHELGTVVTDSGEAEVFVHKGALEKTAKLSAGQQVRFVAAEMRGRRIALRVWPI